MKLTLIIFLFSTVTTVFADVEITSIDVNDENVYLTWNTPTNKFIVAVSTSLFDFVDSAICCNSSVGDSPQTNSTVFARNSDRDYFRMMFGLQVVEFPDPLLFQIIFTNIETKIRPFNKIYDAEIVGISNIYANGMPVTNVSGLSAMPWLTSLTVRNYWLTNITGFSELPEITALAINGCHLDDLSEVRKTPGLIFLNLYGNDIVSPELGSGLTSLDLYDNQINDLSPLSSFNQLSWLDLRRNNLMDLSPISALTNLTWLGLAHNQITNADSLANLTNISWLNLKNNDLDSIDFVGAITNLEWFNVSSNHLNTLAGLETLSSLEALDVSDNQITNISALSTLLHLRWIDLSHNRLTDIDVLITNAANGGITNGHTVILIDNPLSDYALTNQIHVLTNDYRVTVEY